MGCSRHAATQPRRGTTYRWAWMPRLHRGSITSGTPNPPSPSAEPQTSSGTPPIASSRPTWDVVLLFSWALGRHLASQQRPTNFHLQAACPNIPMRLVLLHHHQVFSQHGEHCSGYCPVHVFKVGVILDWGSSYFSTTLASKQPQTHSLKSRIRAEAPTRIAG